MCLICKMQLKYAKLIQVCLCENEFINDRSPIISCPAPSLPPMTLKPTWRFYCVAVFLGIYCEYILINDLQTVLMNYRMGLIALALLLQIYA